MPILAATAATALVAGLAVTNSATASPAASKLSPGIKTSSHLLGAAKRKVVGRLPAGVPKKGNYAFLLRLDTRSTGAVYQAVRQSAGESVAQTAATEQLSSVTAAQNDVIAGLPSRSTVLYRTHAALAGVAVVTDVGNYGALRALRGVTAVYPIAPKSRSNSYAVPLQGAPQAWQAYGDLGQNSTVAIIDTGVDYTHANFRGPGTEAAYQTALARDTLPPAAGSFYPAKFRRADGLVGMYDFVGDTYNATAQDPAYQPTPHPDPNPLDCNSHGSHVAGTVAGYGVNANGTTYTGAYSTSTPFTAMRIGPGMAPRATLFAYKVFGCAGSTNVVAEAIDRALDPNGDGSTADHVNVINMSLGTDYGSPQDGDSVVSDLAAALGITVVAASGNAGDNYDVGGSPGNAPRVIGVAASADAYAQVDTLHVTAPVIADYAAERSLDYGWATKPDLRGNVARVTDPTNLEGCNPLSPADAAAVRGKIAFVNWTDNNANRPCGSVQRSGNLAAAGAIGFIFGDDADSFTSSISGSSVIPGVLVAKPGADAIRTALVAHQTVTVGGTVANGFPQVIPAQNDTLADFSSRGIRSAGNVKPDVTAVGESVFSTGMGTGNQGLNDSGTSMATPMVAGTAALVNSRHRSWSPEQVKADIMNTAGQDLYVGPSHTGARYAPNRVGAGRIQVKQAIDNSVLAYVTDDPGSVSASFGPLAVTPSSTPTVRHKTIRVQNMGTTPQTYRVSYSARTSVPGAVYTVSPATVSVASLSSKTVTVTLAVYPRQLTKTIDPTVAPQQGGLPREFVADASGLVVLTSTAAGVPSLRVPVYSAPRPASAMTQPHTLVLPAGPVQQRLLPLWGASVNQGSGATKVQSTVAGFELAATSGFAPRCSSSVTSRCVNFSDERAADLKYVGVTSDAPQLAANGQRPRQDGLVYFAISTQGRWRSAASGQVFEIFLDTNGDGAPDLITFNTRLPGNDVYIANTIDAKTGNSVDVELINARLGDTDTALFDSDTMVLPVAISALGLGAVSRIHYAVLAFSLYQAAPVDQVGDVNPAGKLVNALSFDPLHPGVAIYGSYTGASSPLLFTDSPGAVLKVRRSHYGYGADHAKGALLVHFQNVVGNKAQVVALKTAPTVSLRFSRGPATKNRVKRAAVVVGNTSGIPASGIVRLVRLTGPGSPVRVASATVRYGRATLSYVPRLSGTYKFRVLYTGDANYVPRYSGVAALRIR